ncbi:cation channel sperm-associated auxiliary subunit TMEM249 [Tenrec ecaudatus]|uniref:cation channel sperm-associated auxiliary subunit TMEM249 n=1 Tax=Tenrec ecaudatus TaxID=94439 RepID=UPI003F5A3968
MRGKKRQRDPAWSAFPCPAQRDEASLARNVLQRWGACPLANVQPRTSGSRPVKAWPRTCRPVCCVGAATLDVVHLKVPKGHISGFPTISVANRFQLWALGCFCNERHLAKCIKGNSFYPFIRLQPNVFALEYYQDTLWKGALLLVISLSVVHLDLEVCAPGPQPLAFFPGRLDPRCSPPPPPPAAPARLAPPPAPGDHAAHPPTCPQVLEQKTWGLPAYGIVVGLWLFASSLPCRRLVLNHMRGLYHFSIQGHTVYQGPLHLIYVRLALNSDAYGRCFFQLVLCGHKLEPLVLVELSEHYEQMEFLGRHIARKLNINYFDYQTTSYRHVVRHWPLRASQSPGIVLRKDRTYNQFKGSRSNMEV